MNPLSKDAQLAWRVADLGDVAETRLGKTINPRTKRGPRQRSYLRNANVQWDRIDLTDVATMHFSEAESAVYDLRPGDLLACEGGIVGRAAIWHEEVCECHFQNAVHRIRPKNGEVSAEWLLENLRWLSVTGRLAGVAQGVTIQHLSQKQLRALPIILPPRHVQDRILHQLTETRKLSDGAASQLDRARRVISKFRAAVLAAACSGRLTTDWRDDHHQGWGSAHESGETQTTGARRAGRFWGAGVIPDLTEEERSSIPDAWRWLKVSDLGTDPRAAVQIGPMSMKSSEFTNEGVPILNVGCVQPGFIDLSKANHLPAERAMDFSPLYSVNPGDVLFTRSGTVGRCAVADQQHHGFLITFHLLRVRPDPRTCLSAYLWCAFQGAPSIKRQTEGGQIGSSRAGFNTRLLAGLDVPLPPPAEQLEIVQRVDRLLSRVAEVERRVDRVAFVLNQATRSILAKSLTDHSARSEADE